MEKVRLQLYEPIRLSIATLACSTPGRAMSHQLDGLRGV